MDEFERADGYLDAGHGEKAIALFRKLADAGRVAAMHSIAHTHLYGIAGVKQDYDVAFEWFTRAAANGCPQAMYHLGLCNAKGYGCPVNPELSFQWYQKSADRADEDAMYELAQCYDRGFGVPADPAKAKHWYAQAASHGQEQAAQRLRELG